VAPRTVLWADPDALPAEARFLMEGVMSPRQWMCEPPLTS
jgi:hypothetical protein